LFPWEQVERFPPSAGVLRFIPKGSLIIWGQLLLDMLLAIASPNDAIQDAGWKMFFLHNRLIFSASSKLAGTPSARITQRLQWYEEGNFTALLHDQGFRLDRSRA
jgi:hypothetical protein